MRRNGQTTKIRSSWQERTRRAAAVLPESKEYGRREGHTLLRGPLQGMGASVHRTESRHLPCAGLTTPLPRGWIAIGLRVTVIWGQYHGGRRSSSDDSFHSPTVILPSALDKPSIMKRYHRRRTCSHNSPRRWPTMVTLHVTRFVECGWWNDGWTVKTVVT